jgi:HAD superfamily hydrolase (TIGR01509 family)
MARSAPPRLVVFDLDGTLVDSLPLVLAAITHALEPFGRKPTMDIFAKLGGPPAKFMPALLADAGDVPAALARMEKFHHENTALIRPFAEAPELLADLAARGVRCAVWTGRDRNSTERLLAEHRLRDHFSAVMCGDDLPSHKPDPAGLRAILRNLEVAAAETLFVGDADVDVEGGAACGVDTILIRHARSVEPQTLALAWQTVISPAEAYRLVRRRVDGNVAEANREAAKAR